MRSTRDLTSRSRGRWGLSLLAASALIVAVSAGASGAPGPGTDHFPSAARLDYTLQIPGRQPFSEQIEMSSSGLPDAVVQRTAMKGTTIPTELISLSLRGQSPMLGPVLLRVGREFGLPPSQGQITNVHLDKQGNFLFGDSFFDVFFEITVQDHQLGQVNVRNPQPVRVAARIVTLPPNVPSLLTRPTGKEHFKCYVISQTGFKRPGPFALGDQFQESKTTVLKPLTLCTPVSKNNLPIVRPKAHLKCYAIASQSEKPKPAQQTVKIDNQFGVQDVVVLQPRSLCVPTLKKLTKPGPTPTPPAGNPNVIDHYACYNVLPKSAFVPRVVSLKDQLERERVRVVRLLSLCSPTDKNREGIRDGKTHLACYQITNLSVPQRIASRTAIVKNQFGVERIVILKAQSLCLPSMKQPPCEQYAEQAKAAMSAGGTPVGTLNNALHVPYLNVKDSPCEHG